MIKGVILDFDGLMIDTEVLWYKLYSKWIKDNYNYDLSVKEFNQCVGSTDEIMFNTISKEVKQTVNPQQFQKDMLPTFKIESEALSLIDGIEAFIKEAKAKGLQVTIATSSYRERPVRLLTRLNLISYIDHFVCRDDVSEVKPSPELFLKALEVMKLNRDEVIIFEDSLNGIIAANRADIPVIAIPNMITKYSDFDKDTKIINSISEYKL